MVNSLLLTAALTLGQSAPPADDPPAIVYAEGTSLPPIGTSAPLPAPPGRSPLSSFDPPPPLPTRGLSSFDPPPPLPTGVLSGFASTPAPPPVIPAPVFGALDQPPAKDTPAPVDISAPLLPTPPPAPAAAAPAAAAAAPPPRWFLMKELQGTYPGTMLDGHNIAVYGWMETSFTGSSVKESNEPMAWNDRANRLLMQQLFFRVERTVVTTGTTMPTWGFRSDWIIGSDYRFTLPRGIFNAQLLNSNGTFNDNGLFIPTQNLYGIDPVEFYGEVYIPNVEQGLDVKVGRWYAPFGEESIEAVSTPLVSRSYTFNSGPEFTNTGVLATLTINPMWTVAGGYAIGNDTFFDKGDEGRFVGFVKWTQPSGGRNTVTLATTMGRGKFNTSAPFGTEVTSPPGGVTLSGISSEFQTGRNNINVIDVLYTHTFNPVLNYAAEGLMGWETGVPGVLLPGVDGGLAVNNAGTANWYSLAQYLIYTVSPRATATVRAEVFDDVQGFRTGAEGVYFGLTGGMAFKFRPGLIVRPELRWDHNGDSRPFDNLDRHDLFTAACDVIVRW